MASPQNAIIIDDDDDNVGNLPDSQRSRSASIVSSTSTTTLRAESPEQRIPNISRLSVELSREPQPDHNVIFGNGGEDRRKRRSSELDEQSGPRQRRRRSLNDDGRVLIDLEEDEVQIRPYNKEKDELINVDDTEDIEAQPEEELAEERNISRNRRSPQFQGPYKSRNAPVTLPFLELGSHPWGKYFLKAGKTVELVDGTFLKVKSLTQNLETDEVMIQGWLLKRSRELGGILPMKINEVCFVFEVDLDDARPCLEQSVIEVGINDVHQIRKLVCTNRPFPEHRFVKTRLPLLREKKDLIKHVEMHEILVARWKFTTNFDNSLARLQHPKRPNNFRRRQLESLSDDECSEGQSIPASRRRYLWRGETVLGGSGTLEKPNEVNSEQVYTYGDGYSGAGGTMRGALMANLKLKWALDFNPDACATLRANFRDVKVFEKWVHEFVDIPDPLKRRIVDILHLSPPCQVFSPIHVHPGKDDEMNFASLFGVQVLIKEARPRIVTLEQTFGIIHLRKFRDAFNQLIRMFTDNGYSTSWQVVEFHRLGLAQKRKRLIIVAAGPGEILPEFPSYTHSDDDRSKPYNSVRKVLNSIPRNATQNNPAITSRRASYRPWDDSTLTNCITTQGGDKGHPSGARGFTYRELAALQGFPHEHFFTGNTATAINKQIGNAVPPLIAEIIFKSVFKHLKKMDAAEKRRGVNR